MSGTQDGQTIRFPALAELQVDSQDRYNEEFPAASNVLPSNNILFPAQQALLYGYFNRIAVADAQVQWRTPNINPYNNTFSWNSYSPNYAGGVSTFTSSIFTGFFNPTTLGARIQATMNSTESLGGGGVGPLYSTITTDLGDGQLQSVVYKQAAGNQGTEFSFTTALGPLKQISQKFYKTVDLNPQKLNNQSTFNTVIENTADLAYTHYFDIVSDRLAKYSKVKDAMTRQKNGQTNVVARVFLTPYNNKEQYVGTYPFNMAIDYTTPKYIRWSPSEALYDFDLKLYDEYGQPLYWSPTWSTEYQLNIQASET